METIFDINSGKTEETQQCQSNGLGHLVTVTEAKWTWTSIGKIFAIVLLGIAQIALGVAIEIFSTGFGTHVASAFVSEGCGDIIFAIECAVSGHCTWASYWENKKISLCLTAVTAGVGWYFSRGAKFSKYGYTIGGHYMQHQAGRELLKAAGKKAVFKAVTISVGKKLLQSGVTGAISGIVDAFYSKTLRDFFHQVSQKITESIKTEFAKLKDNMKKLCEKVGVPRPK